MGSGGAPIWRARPRDPMFPGGRLACRRPGGEPARVVAPSAAPSAPPAMHRHPLAFRTLPPPAILTVGLLALGMLLPGVAPAQEPGRGDRPVSLRPILLAGQASLEGDSHRFGGAHLYMMGDRFGGALQVLAGSGRGYGSTLLAGGPTARRTLHPRLDAMLFLGGAWYREELELDGRERSVAGPAGGVLLLVPLGPMAAAAGVTVWGGSYSGEDAPGGVPGRGARLVLGLGVGR